MNVLWKVVEMWPKVGLAKTALIDQHGARCAMGILDLAVARGTHDWDVAFRAMNEVALAQYPERVENGRHNGVVAVNNHPDTTLLDMVSIAEKAAVRLDEQV